MDEKIVYWVCGLGIAAAFVPLVWVLVQKYTNTKQSTQIQCVAVTVISHDVLEQMWQVVQGLLNEMTAPYNRLQVVSDVYTLTHEVYLVGRRRNDPHSTVLVHLRVALNQHGQPSYFFKLDEGHKSSVSVYPSCKFAMMKRVLEGMLQNPAFTTDTRMGIERPVYAGPEAWTQDDQDREDARLKSLALLETI